jgi:hypothetical protein
MKLISLKGELALPSDFSFEFEQVSPLFGDEGTSSIPATLPATPDTLSKLGHPQRLSRKEAFLRRIPAQLVSGALTKTGQLVIDSISGGDGIEASLALNESDIYAQFKEKDIPDLFSSETDIHDDYRGSDGPVAALYAHIYQVYTGAATADYAVFPVAVNRDEDSEGNISFQMNNEPDTSAKTSDPYPLLYKARMVADGDDSVAVPDGYGISVFLYLGKFIDMLFAKMGYTVKANPFDSVDDPPLRRIVLLNNVADTICRGCISYGDIVPDCTVSEFLDFLAKRFNAFVAVHPESKTVDVVFMSAAFDAVVDMDLTPMADGEAKVTYLDQSELSLEHDTSLDGATPAAETIEDLATRYAALAEVSEDTFRHANTSSLMLRKATGCYYLLKQSTTGALTSKPALLGTNYFKRCRYATDSQTSVKAPDISAVMVVLDKTSSGIFLMPYVGDRIHRTTASGSGKTSDDDVEQKIILAYAAGRAVTDGTIDGLYFYGTTQKYNNAGMGLWCLYDLTYRDYYGYCWKEYDKALRRGTPTVTAKIDYTVAQLMSLDILKPKLFRGTAVLLRSLSYTVGGHLLCGESVMLPVRKYEDDASEADPVFATPLYKWQLNTSNIDAIIASIRPDDLDGSSWQILGFTEFAYMDPPTASGQEGYRQSVSVRVIIIDHATGSTIEDTTHTGVEVWYDSVDR